MAKIQQSIKIKIPQYSYRVGGSERRAFLKTIIKKIQNEHSNFKQQN